VRLINYPFDIYYEKEMKLNINSKQINYNNITAILITIQTWRIIGIAILWGVSIEILHPAFGIPAGVGDILVGITAIPFAYFISKGYAWSKYAVIVWSVLGIADLVMAVSLGTIIASITGTSTMNTFPWILLPTVGVPLALILHLITLYRLRNTEFPP
jgi:magnesium-transporting ATPase (P-type)